MPVMQGQRAWTFWSRYEGTLTRASDAVTATAAGAGAATATTIGETLIDSLATDEGIDYEELKRPDPILWSDAVTLFEDELDDNGVSLFTVKIVRRMLESC